MLKIDDESPYFIYLNFIYIPFELVMLYWFLKNIFADDKHIRFWAIINFIIIIIFSVVELLQNEPNSKNVSLLVIDPLGRKIVENHFGDQAAGKYTINLQTNNFAAGTYFYQLRANGQMFTKKFEVSK